MKKYTILSCLAMFLLTIQGTAQVNLQTGAAQYSLPLYSYSDPGNRIGTAVSLVYTAGNGLKVSEVSSDVGAGWALEFGGYIQRIQHGAPDDQKNNDIYSYPSDITNQTQGSQFVTWAKNYYPNGYLYSEYSPTMVITNAGGYQPLFHPTNHHFGYDPNYLPGGIFWKPHQKYQADLEQDVFVFKFNGRTGQFVIGKIDPITSKYPIVTLNDSKLVIEKLDGDFNNSNNIRTTISEFQITDENGIKYIFKDADLSEVCEYNQKSYYSSEGIYNPPIPSVSYSVTRGIAKNSFVKNKWHLSEIINPLTGVKITFEYDNVNTDFQGTKTATRYSATGTPQFGVIVDRVKSTSKRLTKIVLSSKETVDLTYSTQQRDDLPSNKVLEKISIKYDGVPKYNWEFEQGYFIKTEVKPLSYSFSAEDLVWARLCLLKVKKTGTNSSEPPYIFSYYLGNENGANSAIPPPFSYYQDAWGYYNVSRYGFYNPSNQTSSTSNAPYEPYSGNLLPKSIFEKPLVNAHNLTSINHRAPTMDAQSGILKNVTNPMGGSLSFTYEANYFDYTNSSGVYNFLGTGGVRVSKTTQYDGINHNKDIIQEYKYLKENGTTSGWGSDNHVFQITSYLSVYHCDDNKTVPGISAASIANILNDFLGNASYRSHFNLANSLFMQFWVNAFVSSIINGITVLESYTAVESTSAGYTSHNTLPFQYGRVEVINKLLTSNVGKTVYEFTTKDEANTTFAIDVPSLPSPYSSKQRYAFWLYGLPKEITFFDNTPKIIKKIVHEYNPIKTPLNDDKFRSQKWVASRKAYVCDFATQNSLTNDIDKDNYIPITGRIELVRTKEYIYNSNNESAFVTTEYEYSNKNYQTKKVKNTNSKGELVETATYYPLDYTVSGVIATMKDKNMVNTPISTETSITKPVNQKYLITGTVTEFGVTSNGDIKPVKTYTTRNADPISYGSVPFSESQLIPNTSYYKETGTISYGSNGLPTDIVSEKGKITSIYDYNNKLVIASVTNALSSDIAYTSFEAEGTGNWTKSGTVITTGGITGDRSFNGTLTKTISQSKKYTLTAWKKGSGSITANGASGTLIHTIGDWKLYQWDLTNTSTVELISNQMDEVRLYPETARMTTVTYDPLVGKTSECDAANHLSYMEYDDMRRIRFIRDENRNIIKMYEYNFKN